LEEKAQDRLPVGTSLAIIPPAARRSHHSWCKITTALLWAIPQDNDEQKSNPDAARSTIAVLCRGHALFPVKPYNTYGCGPLTGFGIPPW
jgi:hypothetical protein